MAANYEELKDEEAERCLLSTILLNNDVLLDIPTKANDFAMPSHRTIFMVMKEMYQAELPIDLVTLTVKLKDMQKLDEAGGVIAITDISNKEPTAAKAKYYANIVTGFAKRRRFCQACRELYGEAVDGTDELAQIFSRGMGRLSDITDGGDDKGEVVDGLTMMMSATDRILGGASVGFKTGFTALDKKLVYGMRPGDLIILAGRPSMGKTALALNIVSNVIEMHKKVLFFSLETGLESIGQRLLQNQAGLRQEQLLADPLSDYTVKQVLESAEWFNERKDYLQINTDGYHTPESIASISRKTKLKKGIDLIIIDHLQLISAEGFGHNRVAEITYISRKLKQLAKEMNCPVLVLSQLSRAVENRDDKRPRMSDLRESGSIEQDADVIMLLFRKGYYQPEADDRSVEVLVAKQKDGPTGVAVLNYLKEYMKFADRPEAQMGTEVVQGDIPL